MRGQKLNLYKEEISIVFQKPVQISPPSTPEEIYTIQPKGSRNNFYKKSTNMESSSSNQLKYFQRNNNNNSPQFPKSQSPKRLCGLYVSPLKLKRNTFDKIESPIKYGYQIEGQLSYVLRFCKNIKISILYDAYYLYKYGI